jgi:hypothetical protein
MDNFFVKLSLIKRGRREYILVKKEKDCTKKKKDLHKLSIIYKRINFAVQKELTTRLIVNSQLNI